MSFKENSWVWTGFDFYNNLLFLAPTCDFFPPYLKTNYINSYYLLSNSEMNKFFIFALINLLSSNARKLINYSFFFCFWLEKLFYIFSPVKIN